FDILFNLYQKGSIPVSIIYELLNLETEDIERSLKEDLFTLKDNSFNEILRDIYSNAGDEVYEGSDVLERIMKALGLDYKTEEDEELEEEEPPKNKFRR
ncbi:unnamed protein product, partial [marine sediment metagenome]